MSAKAAKLAAPRDDRSALFDEVFLKKLEYLYIVSKKLFAGRTRAERRTRKTGSGIEFADHRDYAAGDDFRYIDWNIYGRMDKLLLRLFEEEEDLSIYMLLDCSRSMMIGEQPKLHYAMKVCAALCYVGLANLDRVSIIPFSSQLHEHLPPARGKGRIFKVFDFLRKVQPGGVTNLGASLTKFVHQTKRRGMAVVLSDFYDPTGYEEGLNVLRYHKYEPFVIQVYDEKEVNPPLHGDLTLIDCETGDPREVTISASLLDAYKKEHERYCQELDTFCTSRAVSFFRTHTGLPFDELVLKIFRAGGFLDLTFSAPIAIATLAKLAAVLGGLIVVAYILKLRRRRHEVPFSKLWQRVLREKETSSLWRKLKRLISLMMQLAFAGLILFAVADPKIGEAAATGRNVVVIVDASASMKATDEPESDHGGKPGTRIERAKEEARKVLRSLGGGDVAMVVRMDGQTTPLSRFEGDVPKLMKVVDGITATDTPADLHRALEAAADALRGRKDPLIVLIGDGAYSEDDRSRVSWGAAPGATPEAPKMGFVDLAGVDVRFVPVGKDAENVGIVAFNVRRYLANKLSYEVLVEVQNFGKKPENVRLTLYAGDEAVSVKTIALAGGERAREIYPDLGGGDDRALKAVLERVNDKGVLPPDAFPLDDTAWALLPERKRQKVLLVSADNLYLEGALLLDSNISVDKLKPEEYEGEVKAGRLAGYDVTVFDGITPDTPPPTPGAIYFAPSGPKSPVPVRGQLNRPFITDVEKDHPTTRWVTLSDVNIDKSSVFAPQPGDVVLARSIRDPIIVAAKRDGHKLVAFGFGLNGTDLTLRVAFPIFIVNSLDWFAGDDAELITTYRTGHTWSIPVDNEQLREVTVRGPGGEVKAPVAQGRARFYGQRTGIYTVTAAGAQLGVAANLADPAESSIQPGAKLVLGGREVPGAPSFKPSISRSIWIYLVLGALLLSALEWLTYNRRITV